MDIAIFQNLLLISSLLLGLLLLSPMGWLAFVRVYR
jgi:hypothetical protein